MRRVLVYGIALALPKSPGEKNPGWPTLAREPVWTLASYTSAAEAVDVAANSAAIPYTNTRLIFSFLSWQVDLGMEARSGCMNAIVPLGFAHRLYLTRISLLESRFGHVRGPDSRGNLALRQLLYLPGEE